VGKNLAEYRAPDELSSTDDLKPGHGAVVRRGLTKLAAYRDDAGQLGEPNRHLYPHRLSCALKFYSFETCGDCPCHGS
jgi:hypothetical protein